jgi:DNA-binding Xre family transcriptional regulator
MEAIQENTIRYEIMNADLVEYVHYLVFETSMKNEDIANKLELSLKELEYVSFKRKVKAYNFSYLKQVCGGDWVFDTKFANKLITKRSSRNV